MNLLIEDKRKELVRDALRAIENLDSVLVLSMGKWRPDLRERLSAMRKEFEHADCMNPRTNQLFERFLDLQDEILRTLDSAEGESEGI